MAARSDPPPPKGEQPGHRPRWRLPGDDRRAHVRGTKTPAREADRLKAQRACRGRHLAADRGPPSRRSAT